MKLIGNPLCIHSFLNMVIHSAMLDQKHALWLCQLIEDHDVNSIILIMQDPVHLLAPGKAFSLPMLMLTAHCSCRPTLWKTTGLFNLAYSKLPSWPQNVALPRFQFNRVFTKTDDVHEHRYRLIHLNVLLLIETWSLGVLYISGKQHKSKWILCIFEIQLLFQVKMLSCNLLYARKAAFWGEYWLNNAVSSTETWVIMKRPINLGIFGGLHTFFGHCHVTDLTRL